MKGNEERFYFSRDNSGHWYLVPVSGREAFERWANLDEDDEKGWDPPEWVRRLNGSLSRITFCDPQER
jgi:hypothetical protein